MGDVESLVGGRPMSLGSMLVGVIGVSSSGRALKMGTSASGLPSGDVELLPTGVRNGSSYDS